MCTLLHCVKGYGNNAWRVKKLGFIHGLKKGMNNGSGLTKYTLLRLDLIYSDLEIHVQVWGSDVGKRAYISYKY